VGYELAQQPQLFGVQLADEKVHPGDVAARSVETGDETGLDRVGTAAEDNRNSRGRRLCGKSCPGASSCRDHSDLTANEIDGQHGQPLVMALRPSVFNGRVLALDVAGFF
jgi:hypothetical protein